MIVARAACLGCAGRAQAASRPQRRQRVPHPPRRRHLGASTARRERAPGCRSTSRRTDGRSSSICSAISTRCRRAAARRRALTGGMAFDTQPAFSPDGQWIAFVSDRSGADNLWIAGADGSSAARRSAFGDDDTHAGLAGVGAGRHGRSTSAATGPTCSSYELWRYRPGRNGHPAGRRSATRRRAARQLAQHPGRGRSRPTAGSSMPRGTSAALDFDELDDWTIVRRDLADGRGDSVVVAGPRARARRSIPAPSSGPALSPDGRLLAYATRRGGADRTARCATWRPAPTGGSPFRSSTTSSSRSMWQDLLPRYAFTPRRPRDPAQRAAAGSSGSRSPTARPRRCRSSPIVDLADRRLDPPGHPRGSRAGPRAADHGPGRLARPARRWPSRRSAGST